MHGTLLGVVQEMEETIGCSNGNSGALGLEELGTTASVGSSGSLVATGLPWRLVQQMVNLNIFAVLKRIPTHVTDC